MCVFGAPPVIHDDLHTVAKNSVTIALLEYNKTRLDNFFLPSKALMGYSYEFADMSLLSSIPIPSQTTTSSGTSSSTSSENLSGGEIAAVVILPTVFVTVAVLGYLHYFLLPSLKSFSTPSEASRDTEMARNPMK